jgi:NAD-dependent DNA ligase
MGFLKKLIGAARPTIREQATTFFTQMRDDAAIEVVGEIHYRETVEKIGRAGPSFVPPALPAPEPGYHKALLMREPDNRYDPNAIAVRIFVDAQTVSKVGYLSRENALAYRPVFDFKNGAAIACDAALVAERDWKELRAASTGVVLHLGTPGELISELWTDDNPVRREHRWAGQIVTFTGSGETTLMGVPLDRYAQHFLARKAGCDVLPRVTKKSQVVVASNPHEMTGNLLKAKDYGLPIVQEVDFWREVGIPPDALGRATARWAQR